MIDLLYGQGTLSDCLHDLAQTDTQDIVIGNLNDTDVEGLYQGYSINNY
jgi:hypothetical protein